MTPEQKALARHALGLPNAARTSHRNRFVTGPGCVDFHHWMDMVDAGLARRRCGTTLPFGGDDLFRLTRAGADQALEPGEQLDPEDFPR